MSSACPRLRLPLALAALLLLTGRPASATSSPSRTSAAARAVPWWPSATRYKRLTFAPVPQLTDEFTSADSSKWSFGGDLDPTTGCAMWAGPPPLYLDTSCNLTRVYRGKLQVFLQMASPVYFTNRRYFCVRHPGGARDGYCNWDKDKVNARCGSAATGRYEDWRCKKAPYCLEAGQTTYHSMVAGQVLAKAQMRYGYMETRVLAPKPDSNMVAAAWMSREYWDPPYSRTNPVTGAWEGKSLIRQRHWQEIDVAELAMTRALGGNQPSDFVPNVHLFADYDGRHTSPGPGPGPIIHDDSVAGAANNEMHWNPGSVFTHRETWNDGWNTFGVWWDVNEIRFIVNGVERARYRNRYIHQSQIVKFSLLTNLNWFAVLPSAADVFQVDYVRVWDVTKSAGVAADPTSIPGTTPLNDKMGVAKPPPIRWPAPGVSGAGTVEKGSLRPDALEQPAGASSRLAQLAQAARGTF